MNLQEVGLLPRQTYRTEGDQLVETVDAGGHHFSQEAIGGAFGIQWFEVFERADGSRYAVHCYDGVYRSKESQAPPPCPECGLVGGWTASCSICNPKD